MALVADREVVEVPEAPPQDAEATPAKALDIDALIAEEKGRLEAFYKDRQFVTALKPKWPLEDYIRRVIDLHMPTLVRFGGWRWHSGSLGAAVADERSVTRVMQEVINNATRQGLALQEWATPADELYCTALKCHLPMPKMTSPIFRSRVWTPDTDAKEDQVEYASRQVVKIRNGQAVSKAVLGEVRKQFKDHPEYIAMWEKLIERMGQVWAGARGLGLTLSAAPSDMMRFGHLGENSCFATGYQHEHGKLNLTVLPGTVSIYFYREGLDRDYGPHQTREETPTGRAFGVLDFENKGVVLSNIYLMDWTMVRASLKAAFEKVLGTRGLVADAVAGRGTLFPLGGKLTLNTIPHADIRVFVNADTHIMSQPDKVLDVHKYVFGVAQAFMKDKERQHMKVRCRCGTYVMDMAQLSTCRSCDRQVCQTCIRGCNECDAQTCIHCDRYGHRRAQCAGCDRQFCQVCVQNHQHEQCAGCGNRYCGTCVGDGNRMVTCSEATCDVRTCRNCAVTAVVSGNHYCHAHIQDLRTCTRCNGRAELDHVTRCGGCRERRCDNCREHGEDVEPRSLCGTCTANNVVPDAPLAEGEGQFTEEVIDQFGRALDDVPDEVRVRYAHDITFFHWAAAPPPVVAPGEVEEEADED